MREKPTGTRRYEVNGLRAPDARARRAQRKVCQVFVSTFLLFTISHLHGKRARRDPTPVIHIINGVMSPCRHVKFPRFRNSGARLEASVDRKDEQNLLDQMVAVSCHFILIRVTKIRFILI